MNRILLTDSYAVSQSDLYPPKTTALYSYLSSRGGLYERHVFFGLQPKLQTYFAGSVVQASDVRDATELYRAHFGRADVFRADRWMHVVTKHGGRLPLKIMAIPEGTVLGAHNVWLTCESTCPDCFWMGGGHFEPLLVHTWYPTTVATVSRRAKELILHYLHLTGDPTLLPYKLHDFGFRGTESVESACYGGAGHLANFLGTDNVPALPFIREHYGLYCAGYSVPATNHSVKSTWGREREMAAIQHYLQKYPNGVIADVGDTYDIRRYASDILGSLKAEIIGRDGVFAVRPDTEEPASIVLEITERLGNVFGQSLALDRPAQRKGYKLLHDKVRIVHGDGYDSPNDIGVVLRKLCSAGWSADNVTFGMGGGLLQKFNRDTLKVAYKTSSFTEDGMERHAYKSPVGDAGKQSKRGKLALIRKGPCDYQTVPLLTDHGANVLRTVFLNGDVQNQQTFEDIRDRAAEGLRLTEYASMGGVA